MILSALLKKSGLLLFLFLPFLVVPETARAESNLYFCLNNDDQGNPEWPFNTITFMKDRQLRCLVNVDSNFTATKFVVFRVLLDTGGGEYKEMNKYQMNIEPDWNWFYYPVSFYYPGYYKIEVMDDQAKVIASGLLRLVID